MIALLAVLVTGGSALAAWQVGGSGSGYSKGRALPAGNTPTASVSNRDVIVSWTAPSTTVPIDGYVVRRFDSGGTEATVGADCSGTITALTCTETDVAPGTWRYTVTPVRHDWRGAQSPQSTAVTVNAPSLSLNTTSFDVLRATASGQIQGFKPGQTVTFRLDDPTTGRVLEGGITPSPVPANGTATVSVTIPSGIANGSHTVHAVGSTGDEASASITVNTGTGFFATGSYTGNATNNRAITGLPFNPQVVIVKATTSQIAVVRTDTMSGSNSKPMTGATALATDRILSLDANGFTLGTNTQVNGNSTTYRWMAFRASDGLLRTGTYTGNGGTLSLDGLGFSPEYVATFGAGAQTPYQRFAAGAARSYTFGGDGGITTGITSLDSGGFSVGSNAGVNASGSAYHYFAFNDSAGIVDVGSYTGSGADNRNLTGVGLSPAYVLLRGSDATPRPAVQRPSSLAGDSSMRFDATTNANNQIQSLLADGFQLGSSANVNASGAGYSYLAVRNGTPSPTCSSPGSATVTANADAYIDQFVPTANDGANASLFVRSGLLTNRRSLVGFPLPAIPAGCTLSQATLSLFTTSSATGRTIDVYRAGGSWTEGGVTWSNAPAPAGAAASAATASGTVGWDVTAQTQVLYSPGPNNGFVIRDSAEGSATLSQQVYQAREGAPDSRDPTLYLAWN